MYVLRVSTYDSEYELVHTRCQDSDHHDDSRGPDSDDPSLRTESPRRHEVSSRLNFNLTIGLSSKLAWQLPAGQNAQINLKSSVTVGAAFKFYPWCALVELLVAKV